MRVLIYGLNFAPELIGIGKYTGELAAWLAARGHQVRVVTTPPYYPAWAVSRGYSGHAWRREGWQGVTVYRCPLWVPHQPGGLKRLLHLASFALSSLPVLLAQVFWRPHLVWVVEPALFCAPAAWGLARLSGAKAWLHVQDFELDAAFDLGLLRGARLRRVAALAERWLVRRFDVVSTISQRMHERLLDKGVAPEKAVLAVNWVDMGAFSAGGHGLAASARDDRYRAELAIPPGAIVALYSGNMGGKQGLEVLAEVARLCLVASSGSMPTTPPAPAQQAQPATISDNASGQIVFVFCGDGAGKADLVRRCQGLPNVRFLGLQPMERLNELLGLADFHLLPQRSDAADLVMPSKLTGMLASGRPVIASAAPGTELAQVVESDASCGVIVPPENAGAFAAAIQELAGDPARRAEMGANARAYAVRELDREAVLRRFEMDLLACAGAKERACGQ